MRSILLLVLTLVSFSVHAERDWFVKNATIKDVAIFHDSYHFVGQLRFTMEHAESSMNKDKLSCSPTTQGTDTDDDGVANYYTVSITHDNNNGGLSAQRQSITIAAQAQGRKVDLYLDSSTCYDGPAQYGSRWVGTRIVN